MKWFSTGRYNGSHYKNSLYTVYMVGSLFYTRFTLTDVMTVTWCGTWYLNTPELAPGQIWSGNYRADSWKCFPDPSFMTFEHWSPPRSLWLFPCEPSHNPMLQYHLSPLNPPLYSEFIILQRGDVINHSSTSDSSSLLTNCHIVNVVFLLFFKIYFSHSVN